MRKDVSSNLNVQSKYELNSLVSQKESFLIGLGKAVT
jgi:hypothetical protein